jgi:hypothetical protein
MLSLLAMMQTFHPAPLGGLLTPLIVFVVLGFCLWLVVTYVPMAPPFKTVLIVVVVLIFVVWLLRSFGLV